jgi:DNA-directed RNA polymerase subunit M/transcription elongation factor TFIIS
MADSRPSGAEESQASVIPSESSSSTAPKPTQSDTSSSQSHDQYEPIPNGRWTLTFHGNCPKCHHYNKALQVQIEVTPDASQVSYVRCERCRDKWAAFGGSNSTRISLLSTTTTEPDSVERGVRYSLVEIVKLAQEKAYLETLPETPNHVVPQYPSIHAPTDANPRTASPSLGLSAAVSDAKHVISAEAVRNEPSPCSTIAPKRRGSTHRLFLKLKLKITARFPVLSKAGRKQIVLSHEQSHMTTRQFEKSPVRTPPGTDPRPSTPDSPLLEQHDATPPASSDDEIVGPSKRIAEVVAFVASLDKSAVNLMSEQERSQWLRREYTKFKSHRKRSVAPLAISTIVQTSIQGELPRHAGIQLPVELLGVGSHAEGQEMIDSIELAIRRGSLTISEISEIQSISDDSTPFGSRRNSSQPFVQRLRQSAGRPQSSPYPLYLYSHLRPSILNSYDTLVLRERDSTSSMRGQTPPSRLSQVTTNYTSTLSTVRPLFHEGLRPESRDGLSIGSRRSTPSPRFTPQAPLYLPRQD